MGYTIGQLPARASSTANPITLTLNVNQGETVVVVMLKVNGATDRAGGALTWVDPVLGTVNLTQRNSTQKAAASPEASTELWDLVNPNPGSGTLTIPNTGALTVFRQIAAGKCAGGGISTFLSATGSNGTSTNPTAGSVALSEDNSIVFATVCSGATTWNPSARTGTQIQDTDDGAHGGGTQYLISNNVGSQAMSWTFGTSDDWGAVAAAYGERPPVRLNNYMFAEGGDGLSFGDRIR